MTRTKKIIYNIIYNTLPTQSLVESTFKIREREETARKGKKKKRINLFILERMLLFLASGFR